MREQRNMEYWKQSSDYIDGNTVRKLQAVPKRRSEETHREYEERKRQEREQRERQKKIKAAARKNQEKAMQISPGYVMFLVGAMVILAGVMGCYLQLQAEFTGRIKNVATLENEVLDLRTSNDAVEKRIETSVDLESVRMKAMGELGMVYPASEQIVYFQIDSSDYMNQYEDIPAR